MSSKKFSILYVDDEESNLKGFKSIYFTEYTIYTALSGPEAMEILANHEVHIIITDQKMPGMTGVQFLSNAISRYPEPIRIILTGYSDIEVLMKAINECGIFRYLTKPWNENEMNLTINQALNTYSLKKENHELIRKLTEANNNLEEKVKARTQKIEELISTVAHDLRSPLNQIKAIVNLVQVEFPDLSAPKKKYLDMIVQAASRLKLMINRILDLNAIEYRDVDVKIERANLAEIIHDAIQQVSELCLQKKLMINVRAGNGENFAWVDYSYLSNVLENLLSNAIKFSPPNKNIFIEIEHTEYRVRIKVRDEGPGLTDEDMKLLFQKYQQLSAKPSSGEDSSGLGLYLSKKYVETMKGKLWCESKPGEGACFIVELQKEEVAVVS
jgi:two-component system, sensor histidine kinase and response regulator